MIIYQKKLVMQGAGHAGQASHAIGASELDVGLGVVILEEERVGASHAMGTSELVVFLPDLVAGSTVMVIRIFASQSDEFIFGQEGVQAGQDPTKEGTHDDAGDPGGQVYASLGSHLDVGQVGFEVMLWMPVDREWRSGIREPFTSITQERLWEKN